MESYGSSFLGDTSDCLFYFFLVSTHHEISELIDNDNNDGHTIFRGDFCIVFFEISSIYWLEGTISTLHLSDGPLEGIKSLIW